MTTLLFALLSPAYAEAFAADVAAPEPCAGATPSFSVPAAGATDVPVNIQPAMVFSTDGCSSSYWTLTLTDSEGAEVATLSGDPGNGLLELPLSEPLLPDSAYLFTALAEDGGSELVEAAFTTGSSEATLHGIVPEVIDLGAMWFESDGSVVINPTVAYGEVPGGELIARWNDGPPDQVGSSVVHRRDSAGAEAESRYTSQVFTDVRPEEWCVFAETRELDGTWNTGEELCAEPLVGVVGEEPTACSCSVGGEAAGAWVGLVGAAALIRRRRA